MNRIALPTNEAEWLYVMADVPHLVKNLRSMFINNKIITLPDDVVRDNKLPCNSVTLEPLEALVKFQEDKELLLAPKLTAATLKVTHFNSMKVSTALNLFSNAVSAALHYLVERENHPRNYITTAWFLSQVNHWFDLMSSRHPIMALSRHKLESYDKATAFLSSFSTMICGCEFGFKGGWKPVQSGVALSTKSVLELSDELLDKSQFVLTSRFSQDCLENLFSSVRYKNPVPTPLEFKHALKVISIGQFLRSSSSSSYEDDDNDYLADILSQPAVPTQDEDLSEVIICDFSTRPDLSDAERSSLYYLAGYCLQSLFKRHELCDQCIASVKLPDGAITFGGVLTCLKEYRRGALFHATPSVFQLCQDVEHIIRQIEPVIKETTLQCIVDNCLQQPRISSADFINCHNLKNRLIKKYVTVRMHIICKKLQKDKSSSSSSSGMGSRSIAMRERTKF